MSRLKVSKTFSLPIDASNDAIAIVGRRGRGKTTTAVVLVEEIHDTGGRFVVADPVGVWWGLKSTRDGKGKGISVIVMGGEHADVPLEDTSGKVIADFVIDPTSPSVVLDFRGFRKAQMTRFMVDFLEQLYHKNRQPLHVILDEADQFAPQRVMGETARMVGACEDVCKMGRARGLFPMLITQRPAALNKNVLTQAGLLITHQLTGPQDRKALDDWIRANAEEKEREKFIATVPTLPKGEAWFWWPENSVFERVQVRDRKTFDSSSTPKAGALKAPKVRAEVNLDALKEKIAATIEKAKQTDPKELQRRIAELTKQLSLQKPTVIKDTTSIVREIPVISDKQLRRLETLQHHLTLDIGRLERACVSPMKAIGGSTAELVQNVATLYNAVDMSMRSAKSVRTVASVTLGKSQQKSVQVSPVSAPRLVPIPSEGLTKPQQAILDAIAKLVAFGIPQPAKETVAAHVGVPPTSGGYANNLSRLKTMRLVDYPVPGTLVLTQEGDKRAAAPLPMTQEDMHNAWRGILSAPQGKIIDILISCYPKSITKVELAEKVGVPHTSGGYANNLSRMKTLGCIDYPRPGECRASDLLFAGTP